MYYMVRGTVRFVFYCFLLGVFFGVPHTIAGLLGANG